MLEDARGNNIPLTPDDVSNYLKICSEEKCMNHETTIHFNVKQCEICFHWFCPEHLDGFCGIRRTRNTVAPAQRFHLTLDMCSKCVNSIKDNLHQLSVDGERKYKKEATKFLHVSYMAKKAKYWKKPFTMPLKKREIKVRVSSNSQ